MIKNATQKGGDYLFNNACCECNEGCIFGKRVYCNIDGRFHPLYDNIARKSFISKVRLGMISEKSTDISNNERSQSLDETE